MPYTLYKDINIILITLIINKKELIKVLNTGVNKIFQKPLGKVCKNRFHRREMI